MPIQESTWRHRTIRTIHKQLEQFIALLVFTRQYNSLQRETLDRFASDFERYTRQQLDAAARQLAGHVKQVQRDFRPTRPLDYYVAGLKKAAEWPGGVVFVPKWQLKRDFASIESMYPQLAKLPEHTRISCDFRGMYPQGFGEIRILEASLFEDMCAMFNRAWELIPKLSQRNVAKATLKESAAARRGAVLASFYFVEAYLNSIAFDFTMSRSQEATEKELEILTEWDSKKGKQRLVNFREKLLHYPRIILREAHPPLQENNCAEIAFLLEQAKSYRDAIVHANPVTVTSSDRFEKEMLFWQIGSDTPIYRSDPYGNRDLPNDPVSHWMQIVDSSISVVEIIEQRIHGGLDRLFWLQERTQAGPFDDSVFE